MNIYKFLIITWGMIITLFLVGTPLQTYMEKVFIFQYSEYSTFIFLSISYIGEYLLKNRLKTDIDTLMYSLVVAVSFLLCSVCAFYTVKDLPAYLNNIADFDTWAVTRIGIYLPILGITGALGLIKLESTVWIFLKLIFNRFVGSVNKHVG